MSLQSKFIQFHNTIKLDRDKQHAKLNEKRERILKRLRADTPKHLTFDVFNQGSYAMGTGIKPLDGDYDIDVGLVINKISPRDHSPVEVKGWIYEVAQKHTQKVEWRRPCITIYYQEKGEVKFHVDLAIFVADGNSLYLAMGKQNAGPEHRVWQHDQRKGFIKDIQKRLNGEDGAQFRRVIRYLKRWKDHAFPSQGNFAPSGHALTVAAAKWFRVHASGGILSFVSSGYDDLAALKSLVGSMRSSFGWNNRLTLRFSHAPYDDVFERMSDEQMKQFRQRLDAFAELLDEAKRTDSSAPLQRAFGSDFPV